MDIYQKCRREFQIQLYKKVITLSSGHDEKHEKQKLGAGMGIVKLRHGERQGGENVQSATARRKARFTEAIWPSSRNTFQMILSGNMDKSVTPCSIIWMKCKGKHAVLKVK